MSIAVSASAQDTTQSLAFKKNRPNEGPPLFYRPELYYQLWQHFNLIKEANAGNALAQHELGLRYILGEGFPADTVKGAYWLHKAADQNLPGACYNYGIMLNNGWGVKWNPFLAFDYFMKAAKNDMPQAEFLIGLAYTDNLIVKRNWGDAYRWIKKASEQGYKPASETLAQILKTVSFSAEDTSSANNSSYSGHPKNSGVKLDTNISNKTLASSIGLVFIDFNTVRDTVTDISNKILLEDLLHEGNEGLAKALNLTKRNDTTLTFDSTSRNLLVKFAEAGSPEALTMMGRLYQEGIYFPRDAMQAAVYYIRAIRLDSPRAPVLLWKMSRSGNFKSVLKTGVDKKDAAAMFVWYGLFTLGFDNQLTEDIAKDLLLKSADRQYLPAMNELGLDYYTGKLFTQDRSKAITIWETAAKLGSSDAKLRIEIASIYGYNGTADLGRVIGELEEWIKKGSVLAQATLGYCFENGIGTFKSTPEAVRYYRFAAMRGSRFAYTELKQMYDALRPSQQEFDIN